MRQANKSHFESIQKLAGHTEPPKGYYELVEQVQLHSVPDLFMYCSEWDNDQAYTALKERVLSFSRQDLAWLDQYFRERSYMLGFETLKIKKSLFFKQPHFFYRCILSFSPNGFTREAALKSMKHNFDGHELPFLLVRLNDWVKPVQNLASKMVYERLERPDYQQRFLANLPLVDRLRDCYRNNHSEFITRIESFISNIKPEILLDFISNENRSSALAAFGLFEKLHPNKSSELIRAALKSEHIRLHLKCTDKLKNLSKEDFESLRSELEVSRPPLRARTAMLYCDYNSDQAELYLMSRLLDPSSSVRSVIVWRLCQLHIDFDAGRFYRQQVDSSTKVAIDALGQFGNQADRSLLLPFVKSASSSKIQKAALNSLIRLHVSDLKDFLFELLPNPIFTKQAIHGLTSRLISSDTERILELYSLLPKKDKLWILVQSLPNQDSFYALLNLYNKGFIDLEPLIHEYLRKGELYIREPRCTEINELYGSHKDRFRAFDSQLQFLMRAWNYCGDEADYITGPRTRLKGNFRSCCPNTE